MDEATESKLNDINPLESIREMDLPDGIDVTMICNQICASLKKKSDQDETAEDIEDIIERNSKILSKEKLIELLEQVSHTLTLETNPKNQDRLCIGMTGYPNVGKSSVINTFLNASKSTHGPRVSVSSTPGRTKHLQTFVLSDSVMLCDCPGLVFPSFMKNVGEMLCAGVLPIHNMRDCIEPATAIATRIPQHILEAVYGIQIVRELDIFDSPTRPPTSLEVLAAYCAVKGYITNGTGRWDDFRATKDLLRDFNDGVLLFVAPPEIEGVDIEKWMSDTESTILQSKRIYDRLQKMRLKSSHEAEFDEIKAIDEDEEDDMDEEQSTSTNILANKAPTREHKRLKKWGKKGRLLRDKDPYGEGKGPEAYVAFFKNRTTTSMKIN